MWVVLALAATSCDRVPLFAPTNSTVSLTAANVVLPTGGSTEVTAFVAEPSGTPVHDGTHVRFTANLGRVDPDLVRTGNGYATSTFFAGSESGVALVRATSGAAGGAAGSGEGAVASNMVRVTIGAAAVESVLLAANPGSVPAIGGTVSLLASVVSAGGQGLRNIIVTFSTSEGQLSSPSVPTDDNGQARTNLSLSRTPNASQTATVTASAGAKTSNQVSISRVAPPATVTASLTATPDPPVLKVGHRWTFAVTLTGTDALTQPRSFEWDFGDGTTGETNSSTIAHVYTSGPNSARIVTVRVNLTSGESILAATEILLGVF
jgi:hypothetical protein